MTDAHAVPLAIAPAGVVAVTRLARPVASQRRTRAADDPGALTDGTLALAEPRSPAPVRPELRVVDGGHAHTRAWTARFFQVLVEVVGGDRSPQQLARSTSPTVFGDLCRRTEILNRVASGAQRKHRVRGQVRSIHVSTPTASVAEVCARVEYAGRSRAIAGRLELVEGRWSCTALEFG